MKEGRDKLKERKKDGYKERRNRKQEPIIKWILMEISGRKKQGN